MNPQTLTIHQKNFITAARLLDYFQLSKPGILFAVLISTFTGFSLGSSNLLDLNKLIHTLLGTALVASGAGALNMLLEYKEDGIMDRTKNRPIPSGRISHEEAFFLGILSSSFGIAHLAAMVNLLSAFFAATSLTLYLVFYTPLKKSNFFGAIVGAVSGALPPMIGWSAAGNAPSLAGWSLFGIVFFWQFPHILSLFWLYKEDFEKANFKMARCKDKTGSTLAKTALFFSLILICASFIPYILGLAGTGYLISSMVLGFCMMGSSLYFLKKLTPSSAKILFFNSILYLPLLFLILVLNSN